MILMTITKISKALVTGHEKKIDVVISSHELLSMKHVRSKYDLFHHLKDRGMEFDGLFLPTPKGELSEWQDPQTLDFHYRQVIEI